MKALNGQGHDRRADTPGICVQCRPSCPGLHNRGSFYPFLCLQRLHSVDRRGMEGSEAGHAVSGPTSGRARPTRISGWSEGGRTQGSPP